MSVCFVIAKFMAVFVWNFCRYDLLCLEGLAQALRIFVGKDDTPHYTVVSVPTSSMIKMHVKPGV